MGQTATPVPSTSVDSLIRMYPSRYMQAQTHFVLTGKVCPHRNCKYFIAVDHLRLMNESR